MASTRSCPACQKTVFPMDDKVLAEGGAFHRACFKCAECNGQLTLSNFASIKGVMYCKPHFIELFKRRGKYDDFDKEKKTEEGAGSAVSPPATAVVSPPAVAVVSPAAVEAAEEARKSSPTPAVEEPAQPATKEVAKNPSPVAAPPKAAEETDVFISGLSVKDRIAAMKAEAQSSSSSAPAPASKVSPAAATKKASPVAAAKQPSPMPVKQSSPLAPAKTPSPAATASGAGALPAATTAEAPAEVFISGLSVKDRIANSVRRTSTPKAEVAEVSHKPTEAAVAHKEPVVTPTVEASKPSVPLPSKPAAKVLGLGGGGVKCASCTKTVYSADPSFTNDGSTWHRECFKCTHCKGNLTIKTMAAINGQLYCKPHFVSIFKLKGTYDSFAKPESASPTIAPEATTA